MSEKEQKDVTQESIVRDYPRMTMEDTFSFRCDSGLSCFNSCCRDVSIVLTPYDVLRMRRALDIDSTEFLRKYTISPFTKDQKIPAVLIKMDPETKRCPFVSEQGCGIYPNRPWACRMYPLGVAEPQKPNSQERGFYFLLREEICHGHEQGTPCTVREWIRNQGIEEYEMMGASFKELMLSEGWDKEEILTPKKMEMFYMACYDLDRFRRFILESRFREVFDVEPARIEAMRKKDDELLVFAMQWLRFSLFNEQTVKIKQSVIDARRQAVSDSRATAPPPQ
jgi:Fe-S-cluster containining protein